MFFPRSGLTFILFLLCATNLLAQHQGHTMPAPKPTPAPATTPSPEAEKNQPQPLQKRWTMALIVLVDGHGSGVDAG